MKKDDNLNLDELNLDTGFNSDTYADKTSIIQDVENKSPTNYGNLITLSNSPEARAIEQGLSVNDARFLDTNEDNLVVFVKKENLTTTEVAINKPHLLFDDITSYRLFWHIQEQILRYNSKKLDVSIKDFKDEFGIKAQSTARKQLVKNFATLSNIGWITADDVSENYHAIIDNRYTIEKKRGIFTFYISDAFFNKIKEGYKVQVPKAIREINVQYYLHAPFIAKYILGYIRQNKHPNSQEVKIGVRGIISNCPSFPQRDRKFKERNLEVFCKNMDELVRTDNFKSWCFEGSLPSSWKEFIDANIIVEPTDEIKLIIEGSSKKE